MVTRFDANPPSQMFLNDWALRSAKVVMMVSLKIDMINIVFLFKSEIKFI